MKVVLQRVSSASVALDGKIIGSIGGDAEKSCGLLLLLGVEKGDTARDSSYLSQKVVDLRIFSDENGKMNKSLSDVAGAVLVVSQFTLLADCRNGKRPSFIRAADPTVGKELYEHFIGQLRSLGAAVETGQFGADMQVSLVNDGPVTIILENQFAASEQVSA